MDDVKFCSQESLAAGESLHGTATRADVWFALEYTDAWGQNALAESNLSDAVKGHLLAAEEKIPNARVQFIKQKPPYQPYGIRFFAAVCGMKPQMWAFLLDDDTDILSLDLEALVAGDPSYDQYRHAGRLRLFCTNGRRDNCCAKFGLAVFDAAYAVDSESVWQTTHLGGHRFAPTALLLPEGLHYGRLQPGETRTLLNAHNAGQILIERLRGRTAYNAAANAAEAYLRLDTGDRTLDAYQLIGTQTLPDGVTRVMFTTPNGTSHELHVRSKVFDEPVYKTCEAREPEQVMTWARIK